MLSILKRSIRKFLFLVIVIQMKNTGLKNNIAVCFAVEIFNSFLNHCVFHCKRIIFVFQFEGL